MNSLRRTATRAPANAQSRIVSAVRPAFGQNVAIRRQFNDSQISNLHSSSSPLLSSHLIPLRSKFLPDEIRVTFTSSGASRSLHHSARLGEENKGPAKKDSSAAKPEEETAKKPESDQEGASGEENTKEGEEGEKKDGKEK